MFASLLAPLTELQRKQQAVRAVATFTGGLCDPVMMSLLMSIISITAQRGAGLLAH